MAPVSNGAVSERLPRLLGSDISFAWRGGGLVPRGVYDRTGRQYDKKCKSCGDSFIAVAPRALHCDTCRPFVRQEQRLQAQRRYEQTEKYTTVRHNYNTTTRRKRESERRLQQQAVVPQKSVWAANLTLADIFPFKAGR